MARKELRKTRTNRLTRKCDTFRIGYETRTAALAAAKKAIKPSGCYYLPFECECCGEWHVRRHPVIFVTN